MAIFNQIKKIFPAFDAKESRRGIAIYLAVAALSIVLAVALGVSLISFYQLKSMNEAGNSVVAFAAAETGIEWALYPWYEGGEASIDETNYTEADKCPWNASLNQYVCFLNRDLGNGAYYTVTAAVNGASPGDSLSCPVDFLCVKSVGRYGNTERAIRIQM